MTLGQKGPGRPSCLEEEQGCSRSPQVCGRGTVDSELRVLLITEESQAGMTGGFSLTCWL